MQMRQSRELDVAIRAAKAAGKILMSNFRTGVKAKTKFAKELVTPIDLLSEKTIVSILEKEFPDYSFLAEEKGSRDSGSEFTWVIDPIDGTHNFFFGLPMFAVSIGLQKGNEMQCGVILLPVFDELYTAERGKGAFLNGKKIHVSKRPMEEAITNICGHVWTDYKKLDALKGLIPQVFNSRVLGSACFVLANIAAGNLDATVEFNDKPWDFAAGWLLVEEAGGKFTDFEGQKMSFDKGAYLASNGVFHEKLVKAMEALK